MRRSAASVLWFGLPFAVAFCIGIPFVVLDSKRFWLDIWNLWDSMRYGTGLPGLDNGWVHHFRFSLRYGLGLPLFAAGLAGAAVLLAREPRNGALLLSFPIAYYLVAGSMGYLFFRYMIPILPFLCLTAAHVLCDSIRRLPLPGFPDPRKRSVFTGVATTVGAVLLVLPSAISTWHFNRIISETDNRVVVARWFNENVPPGSSVLQSGSRYGYASLDSERFVQWRWDQARGIFVVKNRPATGLPDWILLQDSPLPSTTQEVVKEFLTKGYQLAGEFTALSLKDERVYDRQDAFFVPFAGFSGVKRPGPNISLYKRTGIIPDAP